MVQSLKLNYVLIIHLEKQRYAMESYWRVNITQEKIKDLRKQNDVLKIIQ